MKDQINDIIKNLNPAEGVDVSTVIPEVMPKIYFIFKTGGPHFFSKCKNKSLVKDIYLQNIWPFIYRIKGYSTKILTGTISKTKLSYPLLKLYHKNETREAADYRNPKKIHKKITPREIEISMHRAAALTFIKNDDPENKTVVDHIDGNRVDYRLGNLRWATLHQNSRGSAGQSSDPDKVYELISQQLWFNGQGITKTAKDFHLEYQAQTKHIKLLTVKEEFERKLLNETQH